MQPLIGYNYGSGWYVATAPIITANWRMAGNRAWTLPVGGGFGRVVRIGGKLSAIFLFSRYSNVPCPQYGRAWQLRTHMTIIF